MNSGIPPVDTSSSIWYSLLYNSSSEYDSLVYELAIPGAITFLRWISRVGAGNSRQNYHSFEGFLNQDLEFPEE
jgi:hypothetical protein